MLAAAFFVIPSRWFEMRSQSTYLASIGYGDTLHNQACDIVIYGDSTAMIGIDPAIIQQRTGLSACNISEYAGITLINHMLVVDDFLAHNPRPRFIVFLFAPDSLNLPRSWNKRVSTFEGISYLIERQPPAKTAVLLASHPLETLGWAESGMRLAVEHLHGRPFPATTAHYRDATLGRFPIPESTRSACDPDTDYRNLPDAPFIADLRSRYGQDGTQVIVDAMPTAPCDPNLAFYQQHLNSVIDDKPYPTIPLSAISTDGRLHVNHEGISLLSEMVARQIIALATPVGSN
jgi:hypothetical protein